MRKAIAVLLALALMALPLSACGTSDPAPEPESDSAPATAPEAEASGPVTFTDSLGNEVTVDNPQRVIATLASFAQIWQLAGGEHLVGLTDDAQTEADLQLPADVSYVGSYDALNLEEILALEPDFVILTAAPRYDQIALQDSLKNSGINFAYFNVTHFEDYLSVLKIFTDITARPDLYVANGTDVQDKIASILDQVPDAVVQPTVAFFITESRGTRVQDETTMPGQILAQLGAQNITELNPSLLSEFSIEGLIEANPDYIFVLPMGNSPDATAANLAQLEGNPAWDQIPAVSNGHYYTVDQAHFMYKPNNHWDESYQIMFDYLYK
jgi:iron complex transport system substrate-binding protein